MNLESFFSDTDLSGWNSVNWECTNISRESQLPWLQLDLPWVLPIEDIAREAGAVRHLVAPHRSLDQGGYFHTGWNALCLHGLSAQQTESHTCYGYAEDDESVPYMWTEIADRCPVTTEFFKHTFGYLSYKRLRFMWLEPGGAIAPHRDDLGHRLGPVNIAVTQPSTCDFRMRGYGVIPFQSGSAFKLDIGQEHAVWNRSSEPRLHMIIHGVPDWKIWKDIMWRSFRKMRATHAVAPDAPFQERSRETTSAVADRPSEYTLETQASAPTSLRTP